jgi:pseudouridine synthase
VRLQKYLAHAGVCSRRAAERLIREGRVRVNGQVAPPAGILVDPGSDYIQVDGRSIGRPTDRYIYFAFNKPKGVLSTLSDPEDRPTLKRYLKSLPTRVYPVGRLDFQSEGLVLLTNDGELAQALTHPSHHVSKLYEVKVRGCPHAEILTRLEKGIFLDGKRTLPAEFSILKRATNAWLSVTLTEGRKQQIRRMLESVGHPVVKLRRMAIGPLRLGRQATGTLRPLEPKEISSLRKLCDRSI